MSRSTLLCCNSIGGSRYAGGLRSLPRIVEHPQCSPTPHCGVDPHDANCDAEFFRVNALLLRNTSVINMLDGCGISIPCQESGVLPVGLMVWQGALHDDIVLNSALLAEAALARR